MSVGVGEFDQSLRGRRITVATSCLGSGIGGVGVVSAQVVEALRADGVDLDIWMHESKQPRARRLLGFAARTLSAVRRRPSFVFYDHVDLAQASVTFPWLRGVPFGIFLHGTEVWAPLHGRRRQALEQAAVRVVNSSTTLMRARCVNDWLPTARVAWLGVSPPTTPVVVGSRAPIALMVGRMEPGEAYKGHDPVLDAWPRIVARVPDARLLIVGDGGDLPRLRARVANEAIRHVEFTGRIDDLARDELYRRARILFFPSKNEGFGLVAVEAALYGVPTVGLRGTVMEEVYPEGTGSVLAEAYTADAISAAALPLFEDALLARELGSLAQERARTTFLAAQFGERFLRILRGVFRDEAGR